MSCCNPVITTIKESLKYQVDVVGEVFAVGNNNELMVRVNTLPNVKSCYQP